MFARMNKIFRRAKIAAASRYYNAKIDQKWRSDARELPLDDSKKELYDIIHWHCLRELGDFPNLTNCRDLNDRINWLKLFDQDEEMIRCSDKLMMRNFVAERLGDNYLPKVYQTGLRFADIDFASLPKSFCIKTNHDSGSVVLVHDKETVDRLELERFFDQALSKIYGWSNGEWAYRFIERKVFVEELIDPESGSPPADYKFHCSEGKVGFCATVYDRSASGKEQILDRHGNDLSIPLSPETYRYGSSFKKPAAWDEMASAAETLSRGFKFVRVDMYYSNGRVYVGELTFWPMSGVFAGNGQKKLATYVDFDRSTFKPFILNELLQRHSDREMQVDACAPASAGTKTLKLSMAR